MRLFSGVLACVFAGAVSMALAEDPPANNPTPPATASPAAPADTTAAPAPVAGAAKSNVTITAAATPPPAAPQVDQTDKHFLAEGYKIQMRNGEKKFCRREDQLGSRLGGAMTCNSAEELKQIETQANATVQKAQSQQSTGPTGR
jgi:predicted transglutaminase-like cysteine proteinase